MCYGSFKSTLATWTPNYQYLIYERVECLYFGSKVIADQQDLDVSFYRLASLVCITTDPEKFFRRNKVGDRVAYHMCTFMNSGVRQK